MTINSVIGENPNIPKIGTLIKTRSAVVLKSYPSSSTIESRTSLTHLTTSKNSIEIVNSS